VAEGAKGGRALSAPAIYRLALTAPAACWVGLELARAPAELHASMLQWIVLLAAVELAAHEPWGGPGLSVGFGVQVTVAMLFGPLEAGLIAFAGAFDARWPRGRMRPLHDLSHRSLALGVVATGSAGFHAVAPDVDAGLARIVLGYALAVTLMYFAFLAADLVDRMLETGLPARRLLHDMDRVSPYRFPMTFPGLGWFSLPAARLEQVEGIWPVAMVFGLTAYGRWVCIKAWTLKGRLQERNRLLDQQARELAVHLRRERSTVAELEELSRLKTELVAMASHEVRTPLASIIGYAGALRQLPAAAVDPSKRQEFLNIIERQARRLLNLVERLLTASRLESGRYVTTLGSVQLRELCHEVVEGLGVDDADRVRIELPDDLPTPLTDRRYLSQVLGNLIDNALKYSPRDRPCRVGIRDEGDHLALWVQDQGIGIPDSEVRRIFDRYYRVERKEARGAAGVGLGLSLVRELVEVLGGSIAVESGLGKGSRFTVRLPLRHPAAGQAGRTTNGSRTDISDDSIRSGTDPGMSSIRHRSSNF
jgi:signal transduction histidine kinase